MLPGNNYLIEEAEEQRTVRASLIISVYRSGPGLVWSSPDMDYWHQGAVTPTNSEGFLALPVRQAC